MLAASSDEEEITLDLTNTVTVSNTTFEDPLISIIYETIENNNVLLSCFASPGQNANETHEPSHEPEKFRFCFEKCAKTI